MRAPEPDPERPPSRWYRDRDDRLYFVFAGYCMAIFLLMKLSYGSIGGYLLTATAVPLLAVLALIGFQASTRRRPSPLAFVLVFAGILVVAFCCLLIAAEASAAV